MPLVQVFNYCKKINGFDVVFIFILHQIQNFNGQLNYYQCFLLYAVFFANLFSIAWVHTLNLIFFAPNYFCFDPVAIVGTKFKVAVLGGGPSGACAAEALAKNPNIECVLFERKMDNAKPW